ncbi:MAG: UDPGP type 1 family protein [Clostridia bacterium]|nr:UDPGP type 1 family protein [Clostridia bacterium]
MDYLTAKALLKKCGQTQLLQYYDELDDEKRRALLDDIERADFSVIENIYRKEQSAVGKLSPVRAVSLKEIAKYRTEYERVGEKLLKEGKVAAVLLAGGQGTRLGFNKPKGMFNIGETRFLSIFEQQMENIKKVTGKVGACFHLFIMTSDKNDADTQKFFRENNYFGYSSDKIHFYIQNTEIVCGFDGKVLLDEKHRLSTSPNGNGGWYSSLVSSACKDVLNGGIEWLNVYGVDNVLQRICDPAFIGAAVKSGCGCAAKVVSKASADEKVGVLCEQDGKPCIVEYYEMPENLKNLRDYDGELTFRYGVTLNYLFNVKTLNKTKSEKLPYHLAKKAVPHIENGERFFPKEPNGYKFETLVIDMVRLTGSCLAYEVEREKEFAPVKNAFGVDSVETARALLKKNGVKI